MITRRQLVDWSKLTWLAMLKSARNKDELDTKQKHQFITCCKSLRNRGDYDSFQNRSVTGAISQGWKDLNNSGPLFQQSLETAATAYPQDWTPAEYALDYYATCMGEGIAPNEVDLGRCLRNLPSFLREYLLLDTLKESGFDVRLPSVEENAQSHVDLILRLGDREVTIWSYLKTPKAVQMLKKKIERRGVIRSGLNLLAPIDNRLETENFHGWYVPTATYLRQLTDAAAEKPRHEALNLSEIPTSSLMKFLLFKQP